MTSQVWAASSVSRSSNRHQRPSRQQTGLSRNATQSSPSIREDRSGLAGREPRLIGETNGPLFFMYFTDEAKAEDGRRAPSINEGELLLSGLKCADIVISFASCGRFSACCTPPGI